MRSLIAAVGVATALTAGAASAAERALVSEFREVTQAPVDSTVSRPSGMQIEADEGGTKLIMRYGAAWGHSPSGPTSPGLFDTISLTVAAPLDDGGVSARAATLDGLSRGTTIDASWSRTRVSRPPRSEWVARGLRNDALCKAIIGRVVERAGQEARAANIDSDGARRAAEIRVNARYDDNGCDDGFVAEFEPESVPTFDRTLWGEQPMIQVYGLSLKTGRVVYDYIDPATISQMSVERTGWSAKAFYAVRPLEQSWLVTMSVEHQDGYKAQDDATLCPIGGGACLTGPNGAPTSRTQDLVSVELRRSFGEFSAALALTYDSTEDVYAVELPVYMIRNSDGDFNGGVKLNWRSDQDDVIASVFVGRTFSLGMPD